MHSFCIYEPFILSFTTVASSLFIVICQYLEVNLHSGMISQLFKAIAVEYNAKGLTQIKPKSEEIASEVLWPVQWQKETSCKIEGFPT